MEKEQKIQTEEFLNGEASVEQRQKWIETFGKVFTAKAEGHIAYFRKPTRSELSYAMTLAEKDPIRMTEHLLKSCKLGGSDIFLSDSGYLLGADGLVQKMIEVKKIELGEL